MKKVLLFLLLNVMWPSVSGASGGNSGGIVSLNPAATEILFRLGLENRIAAVTDFCDYPPEARDLPSAGAFSNPSLELIYSFQPDLIITAGAVHDPLRGSLQNTGAEIIDINPDSISEIYSAVIKLGKASGRERESRELVAQMKEEIANIKVKDDRPGRPKVYLEVSKSPPVVPGGLSYINSIIKAAGGINVAGNIRKDYVLTGTEFIIRSDPDVIIIAYKSDTRRRELSRILGDSVTAVRESRIEELKTPDVLLRPGPRVAEGLRILKDLIDAK